MGGCCIDNSIQIEHSDLRKLSSNRVDSYSKISDLRKIYEYISTLGAGSFGKVRLFRNRTYKNLKFAISPYPHTLNINYFFIIFKLIFNFLKYI